MSGYLTREEKNLWEEQIINSRFKDFKELIKWLEEKCVSFKQTPYGVELSCFDISNTLKIKFVNTRKEYQYNLEGIKERVSKDLSLDKK